MLYYLQSFWNYLTQIWSKQPPFIERVSDYSSDDSQRAVLIDDDASSEGTQNSVIIYDDSSESEESAFYSRA